jgi:ADP-glucose pyrophosphorylase
MGGKASRTKGHGFEREVATFLREKVGIDAKRAAEAPYIASMGIYVAKASAIRELLSSAFPSANDFGSEVIPGATAAGELFFEL